MAKSIIYIYPTLGQYLNFQTFYVLMISLKTKNDDAEKVLLKVRTQGGPEIQVESYN